jgi:hypothetical protein
MDAATVSAIAGSVIAGSVLVGVVTWIAKQARSAIRDGAARAAAAELEPRVAQIMQKVSTQTEKDSRLAILAAALCIALGAAALASVAEHKLTDHNKGMIPPTPPSESRPS